MKLYVVVTFLASLLLLAFVITAFVNDIVRISKIDKNEEVQSLRAENEDLRDTNEALLQEIRTLKHSVTPERAKADKDSELNRFCFGKRQDEEDERDNGEEYGTENSGDMESDRKL